MLRLDVVPTSVDVEPIGRLPDAREWAARWEAHGVLGDGSGADLTILDRDPPNSSNLTIQKSETLSIRLAANSAPVA